MLAGSVISVYFASSSSRLYYAGGPLRVSLQDCCVVASHARLLEGNDGDVDTFFFPKARVMLKAVIGHVAFVFCSPRLPSQQRQQEGESNFEPTPHFDFYFALLSFHLSNSSVFSFSYSAHSFVISASCLLFCCVIFGFFFC